MLFCEKNLKPKVDVFKAGSPEGQWTVVNRIRRVWYKLEVWISREEKLFGGALEKRSRNGNAESVAHQNLIC